jgi:branched-chain amino acid transport system substrate-binding protein
VAANAQISDNLVRIGVLGDLSGVYADFGGPGNVVAARMAVEDAGGKC